MLTKNMLQFLYDDLNYWKESVKWWLQNCPASDSIARQNLIINQRIEQINMIENRNRKRKRKA